jgi:putative ABC transport system substrate-binding protein
MRRRDLLTLIGGAAVAAPLRGYAQQTRLPIIGFLGGNRRGEPLIAAFEAGLREGGYIDGQNVYIEYRWAEGHRDRLPGLAADLISQRVDVITTSGGDVVALAVKGLTSTIPIVAQMGADPVGEKLVASLAHPEGNLTGVSFLTVELIPKRFELLRADPERS